MKSLKAGSNFTLKKGISCPDNGEGFRNFYKTCKRRRLFEMFNRLKGMDLIYACLAKVGNFKLVTCDNHFDPYTDDMDVLKLTE
ncbi:MAG: hypothetical protein ACFFDI_24365 [Promethearchaeota archaeon]